MFYVTHVKTVQHLINLIEWKRKKLRTGVETGQSRHVRTGSWIRRKVALSKAPGGLVGQWIGEPWVKEGLEKGLVEV